MVNIPFDRLEASNDDEVEAEEGFVRTTLDGELLLRFRSGTCLRKQYRNLR